MKTPFHRSLLASLAPLAIGLSAINTATIAQDQDTRPDPDAAITQPQEGPQNAALDEVIVTAQRREERLQDVAISMTMFEPEDIANANMVNAADIATYTPSMSINPRFGPENASFSIRGFTKEMRTTASVGVYFAEVVAPRGQNTQTSGDGAGPGMMFDLENIQVLKGPQGTLFGRNTTGGAVLITPQRPTHEFAGYLELSAGNLGMRQQEAVVNLPLHDRVRLRLGLQRKERDGHLNNITNVGARRLGNVDYIAGRASLEVDITDSIQNYSILHYSDSATNGHTSTLFACNTEDDATDSPILLFTQQACQDQLERQRATGQDGHYDIVSTVPDPTMEHKDMRFVNTLSWDVTENFMLKNILAYSHLETENEQDIPGTLFPETQAMLIGIDDFGIPVPDPVNVADGRREFSPGVSMQTPSHPVTAQETWVGELQAQGYAFNRRLEWQGGLYYENSGPDGSSGNRSPILLNCDYASLQGAPANFNCFDPLNGVLGGVLDTDLQTEYTNRAVYGQATYDILEQLIITGGLRYTWDKTEGESDRIIYRFSGATAQQPTEVHTSPTQKSEAPTGLLELQYRPLPDVMLYAKYSRGYRQGSVNLAADAGVDTHDKETVDTFEIGAKTEFHWPVPGRFNIAIFDNDFTDMQMQAGYVSPTAGPTTSIFNAGRATIRGVEFDGMVQPLADLSLNFAFSYLDTELKEQDMEANRQEAEEAGAIEGTFSPTADVGDELPFAPEISYTIGINYFLPLPAEFGDISVGADYVHTGEQRATASSSSPFDMIDSYSLLNLNMRWKHMFGQPFDLSVFATNVRDEEYTTYLSGSFQTLGFDSRQPGMPRMYGARLKYNF